MVNIYHIKLQRDMAFERLQALGKYLKECQSLENYEALREEQCSSLCHQIRDGPTLDFDGGATLLAMIQQENLWTDNQKQALGTCIQEKVQEGMKGHGLTQRTQMQDYQYFPLYMTAQEWSYIQQHRVHETQKCNVMVERIVKLGCKAPSEDTQAMVTTLCLLGDHSRFNDGLMLRSAYINMKGIIKGSLKTALASENENPARAALPFIRTLPALPGSMHKRIMEQAYGTGECPAPSLPEGVTMHDLIQLKSTIPLRGSRTSLQLQLPKQAAVPFALPHMMMAMNPYMNILAAGMQAMGNQGQMQAVGNQGQNPAAERLSKALQDSLFEAVSASSSSMSARPQPALPAPTLVADVEDEASKERQKRASVPLLAIENTPMEKKQKKEDSTEIEKKNETEKIQETDQKVEVTKEKAEEKPVETKAAEEKPAMAVNAELERALEVRDKSKNEKNGGDAPTTGEKPFKKPAAIMKRPSASGSNLKRPAASGTTTSKGPIPSEKERKKMKPDGCSKCRHVVGCTASCWVQRGYHR